MRRNQGNTLAVVCWADKILLFYKMALGLMLELICSCSYRNAIATVPAVRSASPAAALPLSLSPKIK